MLNKYALILCTIVDFKTSYIKLKLHNNAYSDTSFITYILTLLLISKYNIDLLLYLQCVIYVVVVVIITTVTISVRSTTRFDAVFVFYFAS